MPTILAFCTILVDNYFLSCMLATMMRIKNGEPQRNGRRAETNVRYLLERYGRKVEQKEYLSRFDLLIDEKWRCEVKVAYPTKIITDVKLVNRTKWFVNFHRHGELKEDCDFYIVRLEQVPGFKAAIHLVLRSPVRVMTKAFTLRSLLEDGAPMVSDFRKVCAGKWDVGQAELTEVAS